jgi:hypothetical protein
MSSPRTAFERDIISTIYPFFDHSLAKLMLKRSAPPTRRLGNKIEIFFNSITPLWQTDNQSAVNT